MITLSDYNIDHFKIDVDGTVIEMNPPKRKVIHKILDLQSLMNKDKETITNEEIKMATDAPFEIVELIINNNKASKKYDMEFVDKNFDIISINKVITSFFEWVKGIQKNPN